MDLPPSPPISTLTQTVIDLNIARSDFNDVDPFSPVFASGSKPLDESRNEVMDSALGSNGCVRIFFISLLQMGFDQSGARNHLELPLNVVARAQGA